MWHGGVQYVNCQLLPVQVLIYYVGICFLLFWWVFGGGGEGVNFLILISGALHQS